MQFDKELDARGLNCPLPILRTKKALTDMTSGQILKIIATDPGSVKDFQAFSKQTGNELLSSDAAGKEFIFFMKRKYRNGKRLEGWQMATYAEMQEIFEDIKSDLRYDHELNGCLNCGICTATCPSAHFYDYSPREIVQLLWTENVEQIYDAMQEKIWACAQCMTCAARCPFKNSPGGLVAIMREVAIKHGLQSAKDVLRPFGRVMLKLITTGNQLSPDMIQPDHFPDWGPNIQKVEGNLKTLRKAIPLRTLQTTDTAWEVSLKTSVEMYTIWEMTGVLKSLEIMDENLYDVIQDFIEEKREEYEELVEKQADTDD